MTLESRIIGLIGLARRGKYIAFGEDLVFRLSKKRVAVVIIAADASERTKRVMKAALQDSDAYSFEMFSKDQIGNAIGHDGISALGILNSGIAKRILELRKEIEENNGEETENEDK